MEYPDTNPTEIENEFNFLGKKGIEIWRQWKSGDITEVEYRVFTEQIKQQKTTLEDINGVIRPDASLEG